MITKSLLNEEHYLEIKNRIESLQSNQPILWGKMSVNQIIKHLYTTMKMGLGEIKPGLKPNFILRLIGGAFRKKYTKDNTPFTKNSPTDPLLKIANVQEFEKEKSTLLSIYEKFYQHLLKDKLVESHPFFQKTNQREWGILQYKHLDHHLRQMGA